MAKYLDEAGAEQLNQLLAAKFNTKANKTEIPTKTSELTNDSGFGTYSKPSGGIPKTDLASNVQTSLGLADTAVQKAGDTMTGELKYNDTTGSTFIHIGSNNKDTTLMRVYSSDQSDTEQKAAYGFSLKYMGSGSGNANYLNLYSDDEKASTQVKAIQIDQDGVITTAKTIAGTINKAVGDKNGNDITTTYYKANNPNGYTSNTGTITGVSVNGTSVATSGVANITSVPASILSGAIPSAVTATTQSVSDNSTKIATTAFVQTAIDNLPEPMVFKGSLGTSGTITALPVDGSAKVGDTYKVITAGTYASKAAKVGDTFICLTKTSSANTWELIPSGDEPSGTVTSVTIKATSPIAIDSSSAITTSGTRTLSHANSGVTAGTYRSVTVNATGHVTAGTNPTTISGYGITDAKIASGTITLGSNTITPLTSSSTLDATKLSGTIPSGCYTNTTYTFDTGDNNGQIKVTPSGGSAQNISVKGLGTAAYTASTDYAASAHEHFNLITKGDYRSVATVPNDYSNKLIFQGLKSNSTIGSPSSDSYSYVLGLRGWSDSSGGDAYELAFNNTGIYSRKGATTSFGSWTRLDVDTKNTAGSTDTSSKIYLIGATSQAANPQTYSDNEIYATSGVLTTKSVQVGGTAVTMEYNSTDKCIEFNFA